eukprot:CAMPEP_0117865240 /NCGR_PEP_ID=MMETSP0950-20121206/6619_1 /TAXON_ID=44440 /ORGANISM="Chattonella subsalsa, Strain CCMP2191" /LENGTH=537 /DNA_ID=CAMNT_0005716283 /DNA_START=248 /DNA_END=1861 /DNA_ORIENTATION=+
MISTILLLCFCFLTFDNPGVVAEQLNVGILIPWKGYWPIGPKIATAIILAFEDLANEDNLLPGYNISWVWMDTLADWNPAAALTLVNHFDIHAFIGPVSFISCISVAPIANSSSMPLISLSQASSFRDKSQYPMFSTVTIDDTQRTTSCVKMMEHFGWENLAVIWEELYFPSTVERLFLEMVEAGYNVVFNQSFPQIDSDIGYGSKLEWMGQLKATGVRIIFVLAWCPDVRDILLSAHDLDMIDGYVYVLYMESSSCHHDYFGLDNGRDEEALALFDGTLSLKVHHNETGRYNDFIAEMKSRCMDFPYAYPPNGPLQPIIESEELYTSFNDSAYDMQGLNCLDVGEYGGFWAASLYDAIYLYYLASNETWAAGYDPKTDRRKVVEKIKGFQFSGVLGHVRIDEKGSRIPNTILLQNIRVDDGSMYFDDVGVYHPFIDSLDVDEMAIRWPGGLTTVPEDIIVDVEADSSDKPTELSGNDEMEGDSDSTDISESDEMEDDSDSDQTLGLEKSGASTNLALKWLLIFMMTGIIARMMTTF